MRPMRIMVIGGAGFIGSHLADRLLAEGQEVDVVDDLSTGSLANLAEARAAGGLKIHHLDAGSADVDTVIGIRRPEVIVLLVAAAASRSGQRTGGPRARHGHDDPRIVPAPRCGQGGGGGSGRGALRTSRGADDPGEGREP